MSTIRLPAIPGTIGLPSEVRRVLEPLKQTVEILTSVRGDSATELIGGEKIRRKTIAQLQLGDNSVDGHNIVNNAVGTSKIGDQAVTTGKIANQAVGQAQIDDLAVGTAQIQVAAVGAAQIADLSVGTAEIANAAITQAKIANLAVGTAQIQDAAINNAKIGNLEVTNAKIANLAVDNIKLGTNAVSTVKVLANAITANVQANSDAQQVLGGSIVDIVTVAITTQGGPVLILASTDSSIYSPSPGTEQDHRNVFSLWRGSTKIGGDYRILIGEHTAVISLLNQQTFILVDTPSAGTYTYKLRGFYQGSAGGQGSTEASYIIVIEFKR